ncbi:MAG: 1-acyl-sn-glycerol-3-phosphate acyltransferase [Deltaproteobacteria bacterium]|nr:1-acyl-sn-glycerol-3-phosphate acyltransferase [Deltaproteobacteria bacterium]
MLIRTLIVWTLGLPITAFLFFAVILSLLFSRDGRAAHAIGALWFGFILKLSGVRVRVRGAGNIPEGRPVVIMSNHQGAFDIPVLQSCLPLQFRWVAKKSLFSIPVLGWGMTIAGYIGIDRDNAASAYKSMEEAAEKIKQGVSVLIFPEGTRSLTGELLPFKKGAFMLASKSGLEILPVAIKGTKDIMKKGSLLITPAKVTLNIGEPFPARGRTENELRDMGKKAIEELFNQNG